MERNTDTKVTLKSLCRTVFSISPIGAAIVHALNEEQTANIEDTLRIHKEQIDLLKKIVIGEIYVNKAKYLEEIKATLQRAKYEAVEEKRRLYATYLTACCHPDNSICNNLRIFLDLVERIDFIDLKILQELPPRPYCKEINQLIRVFESSLSKNNMMVRLDYLISYRLLEQCGKDEIEKITKRGGNRALIHPELKLYFRKTTLGDNLYQFIKRGMTDK